MPAFSPWVLGPIACAWCSGQVDFPRPSSVPGLGLRHWTWGWGEAKLSRSTLSVPGQTQSGLAQGSWCCGHPPGVWKKTHSVSINAQAERALGPCHVRLNSEIKAPGRHRDRFYFFQVEKQTNFYCLQIYI